MTKPRCFVAMAFERPDTDALYARQIAPVLRRNGITAVIINRQESTEDLNVRIIAELQACDFCIADLTYARPSVYYEAGYAERTVPVIYTVRNDHIPPRQSPDGRVHFDLTMKKLIGWETATDKKFATNLERRLRWVFLRDWKRRQRATEALDTARRAFGHLSVRQRLTRLRTVAQHAFKHRAFGGWTYEKTPDPTYDHVIWDDGTGFYVGRRLRPGHLTLVKIKALDALTARRIKYLAPSLTSYELETTDLAGATAKGVHPKQLTVHCIVVVLQPVNTIRLESVLHDLPAGDHPGQYVVTTTVEDRSADRPRRVPTTATLNCVAPVKSEAEFRAQLRTLIPNLAP